MTLIGRGHKPRDRWPSADYHTSLSTGSVVKCGLEVREIMPFFDHESSLPYVANVLMPYNWRALINKMELVPIANKDWCVSVAEDTRNLIF